MYAQGEGEGRRAGYTSLECRTFAARVVGLIWRRQNKSRGLLLETTWPPWVIGLVKPGSSGEHFDINTQETEFKCFIRDQK